MKIKKIAIIGLGYVGLPLAVKLANNYQIIGFDVSRKRIENLKSGKDETNEVTKDSLVKATQNNLEFSSDVELLNSCNIFIVTVPTPVTKSNKPDFRPLLRACRMIAKVMKKGSIIVFESTVYPGATQEICGIEIEKVSKLKMEKDFFLGYSPERVNPGDKLHTIDKITKVISAETKKVENLLHKLYSDLTSGNVFLAKNIKVAEASKVIENSQRDINIAFINEIAKIASKLDISIYDILEASQTKWNFLPFYPGLVGGHCIGVDPFYLASKAKEIGIKPRVILSGRKTNDEMSMYIANIINRKIKNNSKILILGITFKENVPDLRNSKVFDLLNFFLNKKHNISLYDPVVNFKNVNGFDFKGIKICKSVDLKPNFFDAIILTVPHDMFKKISTKKIENMLKKNGLVADLPGLWRKKNKFTNYWSL